MKDKYGFRAHNQEKFGADFFQKPKQSQPGKNSQPAHPFTVPLRYDEDIWGILDARGHVFAILGEWVKESGHSVAAALNQYFGKEEEKPAEADTEGGTVARSLRKVSTGEWHHIIGDDLYTCATPRILAETASIEGIKTLYPNLDLSDSELVTIRITVE